MKYDWVAVDHLNIGHAHRNTIRRCKHDDRRDLVKPMPHD
jgi:type IV secretory pathway VirD2 relaxase